MGKEKQKNGVSNAEKERACVDLDRLSSDTGLSLSEISSLVGMKNVGPLYKWKSPQIGYGRPDYDTIVILMERGATPEAIFGRPWPNSSTNQPVLKNSAEFKEGVREALAEILNLNLMGKK